MSPLLIFVGTIDAAIFVVLSFTVTNFLIFSILKSCLLTLGTPYKFIFLAISRLSYLNKIFRICFLMKYSKSPFIVDKLLKILHFAPYFSHNLRISSNTCILPKAVGSPRPQTNTHLIFLFSNATCNWSIDILQCLSLDGESQ